MSLNFLQHMKRHSHADEDRGRKGAPLRHHSDRHAQDHARAQDPAEICGQVWRRRNHRFGLFDGILIKDNHIAVAGSIAVAVKAAGSRRPPSPHRDRVETQSQVEEALEAGADIIMLDNMSLDGMADMVKLIGGRALVEASGRITCDRIEAVAALGVDIISMGCLTHSSTSLDLSLDIRLCETAN